jgi:hypothetical protein
MIELIGIVVMAAIAYVVLKKLLTGSSCLFWLVVGFVAMVLLARMF